MLFLRTLCLALAALAACAAASADMVWFDGSRDPGDTPPGKLISDNLGYYGDCVLTGVTYRYEADPDSPKDIRSDHSKAPSRRLLDGRVDADGRVGRNGPIAVTLDFKRNCTFSEIDVCTAGGKSAIKIDAAASPDKFSTVYDLKQQDSLSGALHRVKFPEPVKARYLKVTVEGQGLTLLDEVLAWGGAEVATENPEVINPTLRTLPVLAYCTFSFPGVDKTGITIGEFREWQRKIGDVAKTPAVWSQVSTWDSITHAPIVPPLDKFNKPVQLAMARNETECAAIALTSTQYPDSVELEVKLSEFRRAKDGKPEPKVKGRLRIAGSIPSGVFGVNIGPLFDADNMPGLSVMRRYIPNADSIHGFPKVMLPRMTSAVLWLSVTTEGAEPGVYEATLSYPGANGIKVRAEVLNVTLPDTFAWMICYSYATSMFPFNYDDRLQREVDYRKSLHLNVWHGFPEPGSLAEVARKKGGAMFQVWGVPGKLKAAPGAELGDEDVQAIRENTLRLARRAQELGLTYDEWYVELWDEPSGAQLDLYGKICAVIKATDPRIRIYCDPMTNDLPQWYKKLIDISVPFYTRALEEQKGQEFYDVPRWVNAFYRIATNSAKGERASSVEMYRELAWSTLTRGWNGWGFFAYYRPVGDPWDDFDVVDRKGQSSLDFVMVYPGPRGPIATRCSEGVREGYEDYCLVNLLRQRGMKREVDAIIKDFKRGVPMTELRLRALKAAARK